MKKQLLLGALLSAGMLFNVQARSWSSIKKDVSNEFSDVSSKLSNAANAVANTVKGAANAVANTAEEAVNKLANTFSTEKNKFIAAVQDIHISEAPKVLKERVKRFGAALVSLSSSMKQHMEHAKQEIENTQTINRVHRPCQSAMLTLFLNRERSTRKDKKQEQEEWEHLTKPDKASNDVKPNMGDVLNLRTMTPRSYTTH